VDGSEQSGARYREVTDVFPFGIFRTGLAFALAHEQHPVILVSTDIAERIKAEKFRGACLVKLEWQEESIDE